MAFQTRGEVYLTQRAKVMPITEVQARHHLIIGTGENIECDLEWISACFNRARR
jgi:hypothetical protein